MFTNNLFIDRLINLSIEDGKKLIKKVFRKEVSIYCFDIINDNFCIKFYSNKIYYQFTFIESYNVDNNIEIKIMERVVLAKIFVTNIILLNIKTNSFYEFVKIFEEKDIIDLNRFLEED